MPLSVVRVIYQLEGSCMGFVGYSAHLGCSQCMKCFLILLITLDLKKTGYPVPTILITKMFMSSHSVNPKPSFSEETELGCRHSVLLDLPYFDPPKMLVVDPMRNLYLGVAKHFFKRVFIHTF